MQLDQLHYPGPENSGDSPWGNIIISELGDDSKTIWELIRDEHDNHIVKKTLEDQAKALDFFRNLAASDALALLDDLVLPSVPMDIQARTCTSADGEVSTYSEMIVNFVSSAKECGSECSTEGLEDVQGCLFDTDSPRSQFMTWGDRTTIHLWGLLFGLPKIEGSSKFDEVMEVLRSDLKKQKLSLAMLEATNAIAGIEGSILV